MHTMAVTLTTFNVNNFFLRYKFGNRFPGNMSAKSESTDPRWGICRFTNPAYSSSSHRLKSSRLVTENDPVKRAQKIEAARTKRIRQARTVASILRKRFRGQAYGSALFAVVGDLNDEPGSAGIQHLMRSGKLENVLERLPAEARWTHYYRSAGRVSQFDYILTSPGLTGLLGDSVPLIQRRGIGFRDVSKRNAARILPARVKLAAGDDDPAPLPIDFRFGRLPAVAKGLSASDHCPLTLRIPL